MYTQVSFPAEDVVCFHAANIRNAIHVVFVPNKGSANISSASSKREIVPAAKSLVICYRSPEYKFRQDMLSVNNSAHRKFLSYHPSRPYFYLRIFCTVLSRDNLSWIRTSEQAQRFKMTGERKGERKGGGKNRLRTPSESSYSYFSSWNTFHGEGFTWCHLSRSDVHKPREINPSG